MFFDKKMLQQDKSIFLFLSIPLISLIMTEYAARGNFIATLSWPLRAPVPFLISLIFFYAIYIFLCANLNHRGAVAVSYSVIWILISAVAGCKREILGTPIMPWDILTGGDAAQIISGAESFQLKFLYDPGFLLLLAVNIIIIVLLFKNHSKRYFTVRTCNILTVLCCVIIAAVVITLPKISMSDSASVCEKNGYIRGFMISAKLWSRMSNADIEEASASGGANYEFTTAKATTDVKPNVIFIMSEVFWDATLLPDVSFSEDPLPNFHALKKEGISGKMISNTYGGLTDNVEFEVMTGFSLKYLPYQTNAFTTSVKKSIPALPSYFKSLGYQTIAVHPNEETFFDRNLVYPLLGIDNFVSMEDMKDAVKKGDYISDDTFADYVISSYRNSQKPVFMYNISIQNHWPYTAENYYDDYDIDVEGGKDLDKESLTALKNYVQGLHDADLSLKKITDYFRTVKEPTVIIFFGDHLPALTGDLGVYKKLGYIDESIGDVELFHGNENLEIQDERAFVQSRKIFETPYLIWSNYNNTAKEGRTLSSNYLGIYAMSEIGLELPPFYNFLLDYSDKMPVNRYFMSIDQSGMPFTETPAAYDNYETLYETIQNNMMFGDQSDMDLFEAN